MYCFSLGGSARKSKVLLELIPETIKRVLPDLLWFFLWFFRLSSCSDGCSCLGLFSDRFFFFSLSPFFTEPKRTKILANVNETNSQLKSSKLFERKTLSTFQTTTKTHYGE